LTRLALVPLILGARAFGAAPSAAPSFSSVVIPAGGDPDVVVVADVDRNGTADLIAANPDAGTVTVLLGDGRRHFRPAAGSPFPAGHLPSGIGLGDFNGDGKLDLVIANHQTPYVTLLLGDGKGGFHPAPGSPFTTTSNPHPHGVAVGHFCGPDKPLDVVVDSWGSEQVELLIGDGHGNLTNGPMFSAGPGSDTPLGSADFNNDGTPDLAMPDTAIGRWNSDRLSLLLADGKCGFHAASGSPFTAGAVPWSLAAGRLGDDANEDVVVVPYGPQVHDARQISATVLRGDGKGGLAPVAGSPFPLLGCTNPRRPAIGDVDGDGVGDFVVACAHSENILLFHGHKGDVFDESSIPVSTGRPGGAVAERGVLIAPIAGAGSDIIVTNGSAGTITLLYAR
jgi:hypothetical protein